MKPQNILWITILLAEILDVMRVDWNAIWLTEEKGLFNDWLVAWQDC